VSGYGCWARFRRMLREEDGPTTTEYAVMLAMILLVIFVVVQQHGQIVYDLFDSAASDIPW
jgi:Flp pilus assembly pilin Flp